MEGFEHCLCGTIRDHDSSVVEHDEFLVVTNTESVPEFLELVSVFDHWDFRVTVQY